MLGANTLLPNTWSNSVAQTHIQSLEFDAGSKLSPYPLIHRKNCFILGDSFLTGYDGGVAISDPSITWAFQIGYAIDCEVGVVGVASQGFLMRGDGGYPSVQQSWDRYDETHVRRFDPIPDIVIDAHGINDHLGYIPSVWEQKAVEAFLPSLRSKLPSSKIFFHLPVGGRRQTRPVEEVRMQNSSRRGLRQSKTRIHS